jgi:hypothetical protein
VDGHQREADERAGLLDRLPSPQRSSSVEAWLIEQPDPGAQVADDPVVDLEQHDLVAAQPVEPFDPTPAAETRRGSAAPVVEMISR